MTPIILIVSLAILRGFAFAEAHMIWHDHPTQFAQAGNEVTIEIIPGRLAVKADNDIVALPSAEPSSA